MVSRRRRTNRSSSNSIGAFVLGTFFGAAIVGVSVYLFGERSQLRIADTPSDVDHVQESAVVPQNNNQRPIVINIPGSLATIEHSLADQAKIQMQNFEQPLELYKLAFGSYPSNRIGLEGLRSAAEGKWRGPYLREIPNDPWGSPYQYSVEGDGFIIVSFGEDRIANTEDDIEHDVSEIK